MLDHLCCTDAAVPPVVAWRKRKVQGQQVPVWKPCLPHADLPQKNHLPARNPLSMVEKVLRGVWSCAAPRAPWGDVPVCESQPPLHGLGGL